MLLLSVDLSRELVVVGVLGGSPRRIIKLTIHRLASAAVPFRSDGKGAMQPTEYWVTKLSEAQQQELNKCTVDQLKSKLRLNDQSE